MAKIIKQDKYKQIIIDSLAFLVKEQRVKIYGFLIMENPHSYNLAGYDIIFFKTQAIKIYEIYGATNKI